MALFVQATETSAGGTGQKMDAPLLTAGGYPARLQRIVDLGMQPGSREHPEPQLKMALVFECLDEFMRDEEGKEIPDQPRVFDYEVSFNADGYMSPKSNIHKVMTALAGFGKPLNDLLGLPCTISLIQKATVKDATKFYNKVTGITAMRDKDVEKAGPLLGAKLMFSLDATATKEVFETLSTRGGEYSQQSKIKTSMSLHADAPQLAEALGIAPPPVMPSAPAPDAAEGSAADFAESDKQVDQAMGGSTPPAPDANEPDPFD